MSVCCECCVLSGRGLCDGPITRPEESYRLCCVVVCDIETSRMMGPWPAVPRGGGGNPKRGQDVFLLWVLCVVRSRTLRRADHSSRGVLPTVMRRCVWSRNFKNEKTKPLVRPQRHGGGELDITAILIVSIHKKLESKGIHLTHRRPVELGGKSECEPD